MIRREGARILISGPATLATISGLIAEADRHLEEGVTAIDLAEVAALDSSLVAAVVGWMRRVRGRGAELRIENPPVAFASLARLYGVHDFVLSTRTDAA